MLGRRRSDDRSRDQRAFALVAAHVEEAKGALLEAVPGPRRPPAPLAPALAAFEEGLRKAREAMSGWVPDEREEVRERCAEALGETARRAEWLRLEAPEMDFESLVLVLGDVMAPLDVFVEAEHALRGR
jgi:hypothetical protein